MFHISSVVLRAVHTRHAAVESMLLSRGVVWGLVQAATGLSLCCKLHMMLQQIFIQLDARTILQCCTVLQAFDSICSISNFFQVMCESEPAKF